MILRSSGGFGSTDNQLPPDISTARPVNLGHSLGNPHHQMEIDALIRPIGLALVLNVWFNTKAFVEYLDYFGLFIHSFLIYKFKKQTRGRLAT